MRLKLNKKQPLKMKTIMKCLTFLTNEQKLNGNVKDGQMNMKKPS